MQRNRLQDLRSLPLVAVLPVEQSGASGTGAGERAVVKKEQFPTKEKKAEEVADGRELEDDEDRLFLNSVGEIQKNIKRLAECITLLQRMFDKCRLSLEEEVPGYSESSLSSRLPTSLEEVIAETNRLARLIRVRLNELQTEVDAMTKLNQDPNSSSTVEGKRKGRQGILNAVLAQFVRQLENYNRIQAEYEAKTKEKFSRTARIVLPNASQDQIEELLEEGKINALIQDRILADQRHTEARNTLLLLQEQRQDIMQLEKNVSELHSLFLDVFTLLNGQGDTLKSIDSELKEIKPRVQASLRRLEDAEKLVRRRRRRRIIAIATVAGVTLTALAITLAPLAAFA